jgi:hypothetical protein
MELRKRVSDQDQGEERIERGPRQAKREREEKNIEGVYGCQFARYWDTDGQQFPYAVGRRDAGLRLGLATVTV